jgi:2-oxoglutarate ferredoxin oxidoreductase subunit delta
MDPCQVEIGRCKGCGLCVDFCPRHLLELSSELNAAGYHPAALHDAAKCTACALCAEMCPETAIRVYRRKRKAP